MKHGTPSQTAAWVTLLRALADHGFTSVKGFHDPMAIALLPPRWVRALAWVEPKLAEQSATARARMLPYLDMLPLRTLAIDRELAAAVRSGCSQVVILGAGFDARAYRMPELEATHVFEVDHPATQRVKRQRAAALTPACREHSFVPVDFEREQLGEPLQKAGHRADQPTAWVCEGVTMYLGDGALGATLRAVASRSCLGSVLLLEYHDADQPSSGGLLRDALLRLWSEPQIGIRSIHAMRALIERAGFSVTRDSGGADWAADFGAITPSPPTKRQRLAIAHRDRAAASGGER
jgi:methyltransferase (TIGR00027 family)